MKARIKSLDGLRAIAAMGVLWIHSWTSHGNPRLNIWGFDITNILALGGNGVDLFFVISGFCMYYFHAENTDFSYLDFWKFIKKRWLRLSPAFYSSTIIYVIYGLYYNESFPALRSILTSIFYLNSILPYSAAGLFWTLSVEWQFYLIVPFILIYQNRDIGFNYIFLLILFLFLFVSVFVILLLKERSDVFSYQIVFRYFEFMWGIVAARITLKNHIKLSNRKLWLIGFIILTYGGRILISKSAMSILADYYNFIRLSGFIVMSFGFGGIVYLAVTSENGLQKMLGNKLMSFIGKISYSFYLWHGIINIIIANIWIKQLHGITDIRAPIITFCLSTIILIPVSFFSYRLLEKPFLSVRKLYK